MIRANSLLEFSTALDGIGRPMGLGLPADDVLEKLSDEEKAKLPRRGHTSSGIKAMCDIHYL